MFDEIARAFGSPDSDFFDDGLCASKNTVRILDIRFFIRDQLEDLDRFMISGGIVLFVKELQSSLFHFESLVSNKRRIS